MSAPHVVLCVFYCHATDAAVCLYLPAYTCLTDAAKLARMPGVTSVEVLEGANALTKYGWRWRTARRAPNACPVCIIGEAKAPAEVAYMVGSVEGPHTRSANCGKHGRALAKIERACDDAASRPRAVHS